jgi:predicted anti-sigma-YlaC factor YlaD
MQISLLLDGELSQLERRMLDAHLAQCADCAAYSDDVSSFTDRLRYAPVLAPERRVVVRRPRRAVAARLQVGLVAGLALVALGLGTRVADSESNVDLAQSPPVTEYATRTQLDYEQALLKALEIRTTVSLGSFVL